VVVVATDIEDAPTVPERVMVMVTNPVHRELAYWLAENANRPNGELCCGITSEIGLKVEDPDSPEAEAVLNASTNDVET